MSVILHDFSESALIDAIEANLFECIRYWFSTWPRCEYHDTEAMLWTISDLQFPLFNTVARVRLNAEQVENQIDAVLARYRARDVMSLWWTGPSTCPHDLDMLLKARGFTHADTLVGMAVDLSAMNRPAALPAGIVVKQVADATTLQHWNQTCVTGFGLPDITTELNSLFLAASLDVNAPMRHFLAWQDDVPVATATLVLGAGVAGIYNVTTLEAFRGRGIGTAITLTALAAARAAGYRIGILHSSTAGLSVYRKLGFQERCQLQQYIWPTAE